MTIKSILCIFNGSKNEINAVNTALSLATQYNAHVRFLYIIPGPDLPYIGLYGEAIVENAAIRQAIDQENNVRVRGAKSQLKTFSTEHNVPLDPPKLPLQKASAQFVHVIGDPKTIISREGRASDLIIIGRDSPDPINFNNPAFTPALFNTGRPVLLMPVKKTTINFKSPTVSIGWDGSVEAWRALSSALPLMGNAKKSHIISVSEKRKNNDTSEQQAVLQYLQLHGLKADIRAMEKGDLSIGQAILKQSKSLKSDLLVIGAYGHSRLREMVLGGVTEHMLLDANVPVLFSH